MKLMLVACATCAACAAFAAFVTPTAAAEDVGAVRVTPADPRPGEEIELRVTGCEDEHGVARSAAFVAEATLAPAADAAGELMGEARIASTLPPGEYPVEVACDGEEARLTGHVGVGSGDEAGGDGSAPGAPQDHTGQEQGQSQEQGQGYELGEAPGEHGGYPGEPTPTAPVRAGGGGTAAGPASAGASLSIGPAGLALLSGALVSCTMLAVRRRPRRK
jgi:hypothetical protein